VPLLVDALLTWALPPPRQHWRIHTDTPPLRTSGSPFRLAYPPARRPCVASGSGGGTSPRGWRAHAIYALRACSNALVARFKALLASGS
jgi:hypothetical protein